MASPHIHLAQVGVNTVVTIKQSLIGQMSEELQATFDQIASKNRGRVVLDFKAVSFIDSQGLELLLAIHDAVVGSGGVVKIVGLNAVCRDILVSTRMINLFQVYGELPEALRGDA